MTPLTKILNALEWRGPNGRAMGHVILTRGEAQQLLRNIGVELTRLQSEVHNIEVIVTRTETERPMGISEERPITEKDIL